MFPKKKKGHQLTYQEDDHKVITKTTAVKYMRTVDA